ncbi:MAG: hypothetical protein IKE15_06235 [Clostridia bacterium]|nr:hypothetical protein [Clostridia bacterium]
MNKEWEAIKTEYDQARACLREDGKDGWRRKQEEGWYHLWNAYHQAEQCETKEPLLYARILSMMNAESRFPYSDFDRYHKFVKPAAEAYSAAVSASLIPTDKELEMNQYYSETMAYQFESRDRDCEEQMKWISGYEKLNDFGFHDSKPIRFEQTGETARLTLQYNDIQVTLLFEGIIEFQAEGDPVTSWISEFCCYPCYHNKDLLFFDIGYYRFTCSRITVQEIKKAGSNEL